MLPGGMNLHKNVKDLTGKKFVRWTVVSTAESKSGRARWNCECSCGTVRIVWGNHLIRGSSMGCGCHRPNGARHVGWKHGKSNTHIHDLWMRMIARCQCKSGPDYETYVKRGIKVCDRWRDSFLNFIEDMGQRPSPKHSIDRIDNNKGYSPENCHWVTQKQQMRNMRRNRIVTFNGEKMTMAEAAERSGMDYGALKWRLDNWPLEDVFK